MSFTMTGNSTEPRTELCGTAWAIIGFKMDEAPSRETNFCQSTKIAQHQFHISFEFEIRISLDHIKLQFFA